MRYCYNDLLIQHSRWEGYCIKCFDTKPHATLFGSAVVTRCMSCGHDEIMRRTHG